MKRACLLLMPAFLLALALVGCDDESLPTFTRVTISPECGVVPLEIQGYAIVSGGDETGDPMGGNNLTEVTWSFGDGGTSTLQNPSHTYTAAGTYTVSLTATNAQGSDTATKTNYITVTEPGTGGGGMHVDDIVVTRIISGRKYYGGAVVTIVDEGGAAVSGATVTGTMTGPGTETLSGVTGADGSVSLQTARKYDSATEFCFEVTNVVLTGTDYDSAANVVTKSCESGDVF